MKKIFLFAFSFCFSVVIYAQVSKTTSLTAGSLSTTLSTTELNTVTQLTLTGTIDARDFKAMRDNMPLLAELDLSGVNIVAYSGTEGTAGTSSIIYPADAIPDWAFKVFFPAKVNLTSIILPVSVKSIGNSAFSNCSKLNSINLSTSVLSIGDFAFSGCTGLTAITIPSSVTSIGQLAYAWCNGSIQVDVNNPNFSSLDGVLFNKNKTTLIQCTASKTGSYSIPSSVTSIGSSAFSISPLQSNGLSSVTIPSSVTSIGDEAFWGCSGITSIIIPSSVRYIGQSAFYECQLNSIIIPSSVNFIGRSAFGYCPLTSVTVAWNTPLDVSSSPDVFYNLNKTSCILYVPVNSKVAYQAANQWKDFTTMLETNTIITLNVTAGSLVSALTTEQLSSIAKLSLTGTIDARDFKTMRDEMSLLAELDLSDATIVAYSGTEGTSGTNDITYPANAIPNNAFNNKKSLTTLSLSTSFISIGCFSFSGCIGLTNFTIPSSVTSIGAYAFYWCKGISSLTIPSSVISIGGSAFSTFGGLFIVDVNNPNYSSIEGVLFNKDQNTLIQFPASKIGSYIIPASVTALRDSAFYNCSGLNSLTIPEGVQTMRYQTFAGCSGLTLLYSNRSIPVNLSSSWNVFSGINKTSCTLYVPFGSKALYTSSSYWQDFTNIVEMPEFKLSATTATIAPTGGTATANLTTNLAWVAVSDQAWLTVSSLSGTGNQLFTFTATANASLLQRTATVILSATDLPSQSFIITQAGAPKTQTVTPGGLATALTTQELNTVTNLILTGTIDARDFKTMRDNMPLLAEVDLSGTTIKSYTGTEGTAGTNAIVYPLNTVPDAAFYNSISGLSKTSLISTVLPLSVTSIGMSAFDGCTGLTSVNIPSSVTTIGFDAFFYCTGLTSVVIPASVTSIGGYAFYNCSGLTSIEIPSSVVSIGAQAFYNCSKLSAIYVLKTSPVNLSSSAGVFTNVNKTICKLYVPYGSKTAYQAAYQWQDFFNVVEMPGFHLSATNAFVEVAQGSTAAIAITSDVTWSVSSDQNWLSVSQTSGSGNATLVFTAQANTIPLPRTARVTVSAPGVESQTIILSQYFTVQPLTGIKTINPVGGDYISFTEAITALNANGVGSGGVTFMVAAGTTYHEAEMGIRIQTNTSNASNRIVFQKDGSGANPIIYGKKVGGSASDAILRIAGTDYITFDGIELTSDPDITTDADQIEIGYSITGYNNTDGCNHITIKNCSISIDRKTNTDNQYGIYFTQSASVIGGIHSNILIDKVSFVKGRTSIYIGASIISNETIEISNCKFGELATTIEPLDYSRVVYFSKCKNLSFHDNEIQNIVGPDFYALQTVNLQGENHIFNNKIHNLRSTSIIEYSDLWGISSSSNDASATVNIYNNLIYDLDGAKSTSTYASNPYWNIMIIELLGSAQFKVFNNTAIGNSTNANENTIFCWLTATTELRNNIFADFSVTGPNSFRGINLTDCIVENNLFWMDESLPNNFVYRNIYKFREWQKGSKKPSPGNYLSNLFANPNFTDPASFDFSLKNPSPASNNGQPVGFITADLNGTVRDANTPDIGAVEGDFGPAFDLVPPVIRFQPIPDNSSEVVKLTADITDNVKVAEAKVWYREKHSGAAFLSVPGVQYGSIWEFVFPTLASGEIEYFVCAKDTSENIGSNGYMVSGLEAGNTGLLVNNPPANPDFVYSFSYKMQLPAIYNCTVGEGGTFASLTKPGGLFELLNSSIIEGNIQVTLVSDLDETGEIALQQLRETGSGNYTLTIKPNSSTFRTISNTTTSPVMFVGADRIHIDGSFNGDNLNHIKFECNNANPIKFINTDSNGCDDISIKYCDFSSTAYACIFATGSNHSNFSIDHVNAAKGFSGVSLNNVNNVSITNCIIGSNDLNNTITNYGTYLSGCTNILIENNTIRNIVNTTIVNAPAQGIYAANITGGSISRNKISNVWNNITSGSGSSNGLFGGNCKNVLISNNIFSGINGYGSSTNSYSYGIKGVVFTNCNGIKFWYNTVNLYGIGNTASGGRCYSLSTENSVNSEFCNNIFSNTIENSTTSYTIGILQAYRELTNVFRNNINYIGGSKAYALYRILNDGGYMTLPTWRSYGFTPGDGRDLGSGAGDPKFNGSTTNDVSLQPASPALNSGIPIAVTTDIFGNPRSTTSPDIGAIEDNSLALMNDIIPPVICYIPFVNSMNTTPVFSATITDNAGVAAAKLWYRVKDSTDEFTGITGVEQADHKTWNFSISIPLIQSTEYEYFICAKDAVNNSITNGITNLALDAASVGLVVNNSVVNPLYVRSFKVTDLSISLGVITGSPFMVSYTNGASVTIPYSVTGTYTSNVFEAFLSDGSGNFANEIKIGSITSDVSGNIQATIPASTSGNGIRIRIKPTNPSGVISTISDAFQVVNDNTNPGVTLTYTGTSPVSAPFTVAIRFSEAVQGFVQNLITVTNADLSNLTTTVAGKEFTALVTPVNTGNVTVQVDANKVIDLAGNSNGSSNVISLSFIETDAPLLNISAGGIINSFNTSPVKLTFTFNQDVAGFSSGDVTVTNGSISNFVADGTFPNRIFTADLTPVIQGLVKVAVADDVASNTASKGNSSATLNLEYIASENRTPTANAGSDQSVNKSTTVTLDGTASSDPDNDVLTYKWTAPEGIALSSTTDAKPTFTAPEVVTNTDYTFFLVVNDGTADSPADQVVITVKNSISTQHFTPAWSGNGFDHMNINIFSAKLDGVELEAGDEIGIFDGSICVGVGTLTGIITQTSTLDIAVSRNDGSENGYTSGNAITFKLFDKSENLEMINVTAIYSNTDPSWSTDGKFTIGATAFAELTGLTKVNQDITLNTGWNIISAHVVPANLNLKDLFQTLIDAGKLKKVMDETGKTIENFGAFGGWKNNIGNLNSAKGYKVNVTAVSTLSLEGTPVSLPFDLALASGWNIISYPSATAQDAKVLVQSLIDAGKLKKVMDEAGKTIENFGAFGGWKNNIGNLMPGKGYKVNVNEPCTITIPANGTKSAAIIPELLASTHFKTAFKGNGTDHMSINLVNLQASGLTIGDEIGIYDGKLCVGSATIGTDQLIAGSISIPASANDGLGESPNGFMVGNRMNAKLFRNGQTYPLILTKLDGQDVFDQNASLFAKASMGGATGINDFGNEISFRCYPNPFTEQITIEIQSDSSEKLEVNIYTMDGKLVRKLYSGKAQNQGNLVWDGRNESGVHVVQGIYLINANGKIEKVVMKN